MASGVFRYGGFVDPTATRSSFYRDGKTATDLGDRRSSGTRTHPHQRQARRGDRDAARRAARARRGDDGARRRAAARLQARRDARRQHRLRLRPHDARAAGQPARARASTRSRSSAMMIEGARLFEPRNRARLRRSAQPHPHRGREDLLRGAAARRYDVIVSEPSNPWVSGVSTLFSEEFYAQMRALPQGRRPARAVDPGLRDRRRPARLDLQGAGQATSATTRSTRQRRGPAHRRDEAGACPP